LRRLSLRPSFPLRVAWSALARLALWLVGAAPPIVAALLLGPPLAARLLAAFGPPALVAAAALVPRAALIPAGFAALLVAWAGPLVAVALPLATAVPVATTIPPALSITVTDVTSLALAASR
jgi:hypothetical protein